jgi:dTDP-4-amino-4,6-dideoxygalactose transaminase
MRDPLASADPHAGFLAHAGELREAVERVLSSGHYILGPEGTAFENEFSAYQGGGTTAGVANGTDALELALRAVGVQRGDAVATVANTVSATAAAIEQVGARLVFVEIDPGTPSMSPAALDAVLGAERGRIKAVVPVHLYGEPADMPRILETARRHGAKVVEDCAQSHGAAILGRKTGTWGDAAAFSFYPTKNLGALGDGGAVFSCDAGIADRVRLLRQYGWRQRYVSEIPGRNSRLDEIQAAILRVKLHYLDRENAIRAMHAAQYARRLGPGATTRSNLRLPIIPADTTPVWHQFAVRSGQRDALRQWLESRGIHCAVLYPTPLHRQPAYAVPALQLPETERACEEVLCLPVHPGLRPEDIDRVCDEILGWTNR